jgi:hypothetical protein
MLVAPHMAKSAPKKHRMLPGGALCMFNACGFICKGAHVNFNLTAHMDLDLCTILRRKHRVVQHIDNCGSPVGMKRFPVPGTTLESRFFRYIFSDLIIHSVH